MYCTSQNNKCPDDFSSAKITRLASELPWLQKDIHDMWGLMHTLSDLRVLYALHR